MNSKKILDGYMGIEPFGMAKPKPKPTPSPHHKRRSRKSRLCQILNDKNYKILINSNTPPPSRRRKGINLINVIILLIITILSHRFSFLVSVHGQPPPSAGFLDFDNLPTTRFSCEGKVIGGYYADVEAGCQMFHVCTLGQKDEVQDIKFLCLNGTVFDQETRVCERVDEVDCSQAEKFYDLNLNLYVPHVTTPKGGEDAAPPIPPTATATTTTTTTTTVATTTKTTTQRPITQPPPPQRSQSIFSTFVAPTANSNSNEREKSGNNGNGGKPYSAYTYFHRTPHSVISSGYNSQLRQSYLINHQDGGGNDPNSRENPNSNPQGRKAPTVLKPYSSSPSTSPRTAVVYSSRPPYRGPQAPTLGPSSETAEQLAQSQRHSKEYGESGDREREASKYVIRPQSSSEEQQSREQQQQQQQQRHAQEQAQAHAHTHLGPYPEEDYYDESADPADYTISSSTESALPKSHTQVEFRDRTNRESKKEASSSNPAPTPPPLPLSLKKAHRKILEEQQKQQQRERLRNASTTSSTTTTTTTTEEPFYYEDEYPLPGENGGSAGAEEYIYDENDETTGINANEHHFTHFDVPRIPYAKPNVSRVLVTNGKPFLPRLRRQSFGHHFVENPWNYYLNYPPSYTYSEEGYPSNLYTRTRDEKKRKRRRRRRRRR